jgi:hypothetical protein
VPLVFSYGTLQEEGVQRKTFGRLFQGHRDELPESEQSLVKIEDPQVVAGGGRTHHANVTFNGRRDSRVIGMDSRPARFGRAGLGVRRRPVRAGGAS